MIELTVRRVGSRWHVLWPYKRVGNSYELPDGDEWKQLEEWWRRAYIGDPGGRGSHTRAKLLADVDMAARRESPPVPFKLIRLEMILREYGLPPTVSAPTAAGGRRRPQGVADGRL